MKTAHRSTFGQKIARYPIYLRLQLQRRWLAMTRLLRVDRPAARRLVRTAARIETSGGKDEPRPPRISQNVRIWIFATVTGAVAIVMLVFQISATLKDNARLAAIEAEEAAKQKAVSEQVLVPEPAEEFNFLADAHEHQHEGAHDDHAPKFGDSQTEPAPILPPAEEKHEEKHRNNSPFTLLPYVTKNGKPTNETVPELAAAAQHEPTAPPFTPPPLDRVESPETAPLTKADEPPFESFDNATGKIGLNVDKPDPLSEPTPTPTAANDTPVAAAEPQPEPKIEPNPFAAEAPKLSPPEVVTEPAPLEIANPKTPDDITDHSFDTKEPEPVETPASTPSLDLPAAAPEQPAIEAPIPTPEVVPEVAPKAIAPETIAPEVLPVAPELNLDAPSQHEEPKPTAPATEEPISPAPKLERPTPLIAPVEPADKPDTESVKPEPDNHPDPKPEASEWSAPNPKRDDTRAKSLVSPDMYREKGPAWRLFPPLAINGEPDAILSADSEDKELHVAVVKTTATKSPIRETLSYEILVYNKSDKTVDGLLIEDRVPDSMEVADVTPQAAFENGKLRWLLTKFRPGERRKLQVSLLPTQGRAAESVATAPATAAVSSNTDVQKSKVQIEVHAAVGHCGYICPISYRVTNISGEPLTNLVLRTVLPDHLTHEKGQSLDLLLGRLEPGESRDARLHPHAKTAGTATVRASIVIGGDSVQETSANLHIVGTVDDTYSP